MQASSLRFSRLFGNGRPVVVAIDHGMFDGPIEGMEDIAGTAKHICQDVDAVLVSPGVLGVLGPQTFGRRGGPLAIVRINWGTVYCFSWNYTSGETVEAYSVKDALRLGADAVLVSLSLRTGSEARDAANVALFSRLCREAHDYGLVVIGEYFPVDYPKLSAAEVHEEVKIGCRVLAELGADAIKSYHTERFVEVRDGCPAPILTLGGSKFPREIDALKLAERQVRDGSAGVVFGRNALQARDPIAFQKALIEVVRNGIGAEDAAGKHGIEIKEYHGG